MRIKTHCLYNEQCTAIPLNVITVFIFIIIKEHALNTHLVYLIVFVQSIDLQYLYTCSIYVFFMKFDDNKK